LKLVYYDEIVLYNIAFLEKIFIRIFYIAKIKSIAFYLPDIFFFCTFLWYRCKFFWFIRLYPCWRAALMYRVWFNDNMNTNFSLYWNFGTLKSVSWIDIWHTFSFCVIVVFCELGTGVAVKALYVTIICSLVGRACCVYLFISRSCSSNSQHLQVANWVTAPGVGQYAYVKYLWARANSFHCFNALCPLPGFFWGKGESETGWWRGCARKRNMHIIANTFPNLATHICTWKT